MATPHQARVDSTDSIELFRNQMIIFLTKARRAVDDVSEEVRRTRGWLQNDQRVHWESEIRRRKKAFEQAQQEMMSARINNNSETAMQARQLALNKAQRAIDEGENKLRMLKKWNQSFDSSVDPGVKRLESLRQFLDQQMPKGIAYLANVNRLLEAYAENRSASGGADSPAPSASESASVASGSTPPPVLESPPPPAPEAVPTLDPAAPTQQARLAPEL